MKKVLNSFLFYLIIGIILCIFVILKVYIMKYKSVYQDKVYTLTGKVSKVILSEKKVSFVLKDKPFHTNFILLFLFSSSFIIFTT